MNKSQSNSQLIFRGEAIELSVVKQRVAIVTFDSKTNERVNLLSSSVMAELAQVLDLLEKPGAYHGAVFRSSKPDCFIAGADIKEILKAQEMPAEVAFEGCQSGKALLARIEALPFVTVAAIRGRCLGGGTELALVCDHRLATDSKSTVIGLPEVALGVLPGWGGTVRLPLMLGFATAVPLVINPLKAWSARKAFEKGLVSELVPEDRLFKRAVEVALGSPPRCACKSVAKRVLRYIGDSAPVRSVLSTIFGAVIKIQTRGKYPAPGYALQVMNAAMEIEKAKAFTMESRVFASLCHTKASVECVQKFIEYQKSKKEKSQSK